MKLCLSRYILKTRQVNRAQFNDQNRNIAWCVLKSHKLASFILSKSTSDNKVTSLQDVDSPNNDLRGTIMVFSQSLHTSVSTSHTKQMFKSYYSIPKKYPHLPSTHIDYLQTYIRSMAERFYAQCPEHDNPLIRSIGNYTRQDLLKLYKKYRHKRPKHILL